jgi:hypothetical protein
MAPVAAAICVRRAWQPQPLLLSSSCRCAATAHRSDRNGRLIRLNIIIEWD